MKRRGKCLTDVSWMPNRPGEQNTGGKSSVRLLILD